MQIELTHLLPATASIAVTECFYIMAAGACARLMIIGVGRLRKTDKAIVKRRENRADAWFIGASTVPLLSAGLTLQTDNALVLTFFALIGMAASYDAWEKSLPKDTKTTPQDT